MAHCKIEAGETVYQLVVDGVEGELADYGAPSFCEVAGVMYMALVPGVDDEGNPEDIQIYRVIPEPVSAEVELVDFGELEDSEDDAAEEDVEEDSEDDSEEGQEQLDGR